MVIAQWCLWEMQPLFSAFGLTISNVYCLFVFVYFAYLFIKVRVVLTNSQHSAHSGAHIPADPSSSSSFSSLLLLLFFLLLPLPPLLPPRVKPQHRGGREGGQHGGLRGILTHSLQLDFVETHLHLRDSRREEKHWWIRYTMMSWCNYGCVPVSTGLPGYVVSLKHTEDRQSLVLVDVQWLSCGGATAIVKTSHSELFTIGQR